jgi:hypothetical protein
MNGGEGSLGDKAYLALWRVEELAERNAGYNVPDCATDLFLLGSNGAGEAFAFDTRCSPPAIIAIPFIGLDDWVRRHCDIHELQGISGRIVYVRNSVFIT